MQSVPSRDPPEKPFLSLIEDMSCTYNLKDVRIVNPTFRESGKENSTMKSDTRHQLTLFHASFELFICLDCQLYYLQLNKYNKFSDAINFCIVPTASVAGYVQYRIYVKEAQYLVRLNDDGISAQFLS